MSLPNINHTDRYIKLLKENTELKKELLELRKECEENTIISSMNDMKKSYEIQEKKIEKYKSCLTEMYNYSKTIKTMTEVISDSVSEYSNMRTFRYELKTRLEFIIEILEITLKKKNELLYLEYNL